MKKLLAYVVVALMVLTLCSCDKVDTASSKEDESLCSDRESVADGANENSETNEQNTPEFEVNDIVLNAKPGELYVQVADIYLSPLEALTVQDFMDRVVNSSLYSNLTCEIKTDVLYTPGFIVSGKDELTLAFYYNNQYLFQASVINVSNEAAALKDCYAYAITVKGESSIARDMLWYSSGIAHRGGGHTLSSIQAMMKEWGVKCDERYEYDDTVLAMDGNLPEAVVSFEQHGTNIHIHPSIDIEIDRSSGEMISFRVDVVSYWMSSID